jgi:DNA-binding CsgD family transcriptional regulator
MVNRPLQEAQPAIWRTRPNPFGSHRVPATSLWLVIGLLKGRALSGVNSVRVRKSEDFDIETTFERWLGLLDGRPRLVITRDLEIVWQSENAALLVQPPVPLCVKDGYLAADTNLLATELADFIENIGPECETLLAKGADKKHWALAMALSPKEKANLVCLMLNLSVPHRSVQQSGLATALRLTATEARVLDQFARLNTPREIADIMDVSLSTVRSHLKQIHCKAGVVSAVQLTQLVRGYCSC